MFSVLKQSEQFEGINRKVQFKPLKWGMSEDPQPKEEVTEVLVILKWGGELTHIGQNQAIALGTSFRDEVYPPDNEGILRLHSTYR